MVLQERIQEDLKAALKGGKNERLEVLRFLLAQIHNREIEKRGAEKGAGLTDEDIVQVFQKEAKRRKEAIDLFRKGGREELAGKEERELEIIWEYLPKPFSREEIARMVEDAYGGGARDFNSLMREVMKRVAGRADGKQVGELVRARIK
ncbi:GatB/YqeY domain-containing protein [Candidatus Parcubacteria bacterium]|nr:MAG: GatB/YqeY domain-containing protein [Candidatus Parcubacteria bacterium]